MNKRLWLFIEFPCLALEAWFGATDANRTPPQLLLGQGGHNVLQCNAVAESRGIKTGMSVNTAYCLLEEADIAHYDAALEQEQLQRLALVLYRLCADIRLCPPSGVLLEIGSMLTLFGGLEPFVHRLHGELRHSGHRYHCATGHTALAARVLARNRCPLYSLDPNAVRAALDRLPVAALDLPGRDAAKLAAMGLATYARLRRAPRTELGYRFGVELVQHLNALEHPDTLGQRFTLPPHFSERLELVHEATQADALLFPLKRLLQALESYLQARQQRVDSLHLRLEHRDRPPTRLRVQAVRGAKTFDEWQHLVALALERQPLPEPVIALRLRAMRFHDDAGQSGDLLGTAYPAADAGHLLSLLVSRLGHERVLTPLCSPDPRPLQAGHLAPAATKGPSAEQVAAPRRQPVFLLREPQPITPADYQCLSGAERVVMGHWAEARPFRRDYFRAWQRQRQQVHWLARHDDGRWYLEGVFS